MWFWYLVLGFILFFIILMIRSVLINDGSEKNKREDEGESKYTTIIHNPVTKRYFELTEKAGILYRSAKYTESLNCCYEIILNIEALKKEFSDIKYCNKEFIFYTLMNLCHLGITEIGDITFKGICNSDIISEGRLKEDVKEQIDAEIGYTMNANVLKAVIQYFNNIDILSNIEKNNFFETIDQTIESKQKYLEDKELVIKVVFEKLKAGKIKQKEIYKEFTEFDGRYICKFIKEMEKENMIIREKEGKDYFISLK